MAFSFSAKDKLNLISDLATLLGAGIPILESTESLLEDAHGSQRKVLLSLKKDLEQGNKISDSFARFPQAFDPVTINLIKASEEAGTLDTTLKDLIISIKKDIEFSDKVKGALAYPLVVLFVFSMVLLAILIFAIPKIAGVFRQLNADLPLPTRALIFLSDAIIYYLPLVLFFLALIIVALLILYRTQKQTLLNLFFGLPLIDILIRQIDLTKFTHSMSLLLSAGIPLPEALDLSDEVVVKKEISKMINTSKHKVSAGQNLAEGFKQYKKIIPSIMIRITEAGEKTGTLNKAMQDLSEYFDYQVSNSLRTITVLLEPTLLVIVGLLVGGVMMSIIAPIYNLIGNLSAAPR